MNRNSIGKRLEKIEKQIQYLNNGKGKEESNSLDSLLKISNLLQQKSKIILQKSRRPNEDFRSFR